MISFYMLAAIACNPFSCSATPVARFSSEQECRIHQNPLLICVPVFEWLLDATPEKKP